MFILLFACTSLLAQKQTEINGCYVTHYSTSFQSCHSFEVCGNVYVETDPTEPVDMYVKVVKSIDDATYKIYRTNNEPQKCGEWRFVSKREDAKFTIRYVKEQEDCRIVFVKDRSLAGFF